MAVNPYYVDPQGGWMVAFVSGCRILLVKISADASLEPITIFHDDTVYIYIYIICIWC